MHELATPPGGARSMWCRAGARLAAVLGRVPAPVRPPGTAARRGSRQRGGFRCRSTKRSGSRKRASALQSPGIRMAGPTGAMSPSRKAHTDSTSWRSSTACDADNGVWVVPGSHRNGQGGTSASGCDVPGRIGCRMRVADDLRPRRCGDVRPSGGCTVRSPIAALRAA